LFRGLARSRRRSKICSMGKQERTSAEIITFAPLGVQRRRSALRPQASVESPEQRRQRHSWYVWLVIYVAGFAAAWGLFNSLRLLLRH
jgi:hypothetical protein